MYFNTYTRVNIREHPMTVCVCVCVISAVLRTFFSFCFGLRRHYVSDSKRNEECFGFTIVRFCIWSVRTLFRAAQVLRFSRVTLFSGTEIVSDR